MTRHQEIRSFFALNAHEGTGVIHAGVGPMALRGDWHGQDIVAGLAPCLSFVLVRHAPREMLRVFRSGSTVILEFYWPAAEAGVFLRCRIELNSRDQWRLRHRRHAHQAANQQSSQLAILAMTLLLAVCGWIVGGAEGMQRALMGSTPRPDETVISRESMYRWFGARPLAPAEVPDLFAILAKVCSRAGLVRLPDLYCLPAPRDMNAYALGGPDRSAIVLTEGLLRGMTRDEIAGILAHEVAHIRNNDARTMGWATALRRAIDWTSLAGLALLRTSHHHGGMTSSRPLTMLLSAAPTLGQLLGLALSRVREMDADATALELTGDSRALIAALDKLERHHTGSAPSRTSAFAHDPARLLRSHPATSERVGTLLNLAY
ncbi:zinc metalloprotease HtpX [Bradyrhizobium japonicum]|uniref:zinc metalloprotease HtpX n=1 Tax=Bradyrhizobium japonicum TaxID=375 RepID=UPI001BA59433|nr:zinc metalloprotease HtpX [Bradyrhizobium japonicum]MBR0961646.1 M48 family metalloprotease [Bradyrhizobium japonicum]